MYDFDRLFDRAARRKGGADALERLLPVPADTATLEGLADDRYLSAMCRSVFQSGFVWRVVDAKWGNFEAVFSHFDPGVVRMLSDEALETMMQDRGLIRHYKKLHAVRDNATFVAEVAEEHGGFGRYLAAWPADQTTALWRELGRRGSRLGGNTGPFFLRSVGKDTFLLTTDVVASLIEQDIVDKKPTSQKALGAVQRAFDTWQAQSGRPLCQISRVLSCTVGDNHGA